MAQTGSGCGCWIFLIFAGFVVWSIYLLGVDVHYYMKHGYWFDHGSVLEAMEADGKPVFTDWIGIRKILGNITHKPWLEVLCLGCIVSGFLKYWDSKE